MSFLKMRTLVKDLDINAAIISIIHNYTQRDYRLTQLIVYKIYFLLVNKAPRVVNFFKLLLLPHEITKKIYKTIDYASLTEMIILSEIDLFPEAFSAIYKRKELYDKQSELLPCNYSTMYRCKCGETKTRVREFQLRSIDEPTTVMAQCISCLHVWVPGYENNT